MDTGSMVKKLAPLCLLYFLSLLLLAPKLLWAKGGDGVSKFRGCINGLIASSKTSPIGNSAQFSPLPSSKDLLKGKHVSKRLLRAGSKQLAGFAHFTSVLSLYLTARILIEIDAGRLEGSEGLRILEETLLSKEMALGYFRFVGAHSTAEAILDKGLARAAPNCAKAAKKVSQKAALGKALFKQWSIICAVVFSLELSHSLTRELQDEDFASWRENFLSKLRDQPKSLLAEIFKMTGSALGELDGVDILISNAAFLAGMAVGSLVPGLGQSGAFQLFLGFFFADIASSHLSPAVKERLIKPFSALSSYGRLLGLREDIVPGPSSEDLSKPLLQNIRSSNLIKKRFDDLASAHEKERAAARAAFEASLSSLFLASRGKLDDSSTSLLTHASIGSWAIPFSRVKEYKRLSRVLSVLDKVRGNLKEKAESYLEKIDTQVKRLERLVSQGSPYWQELLELADRSIEEQNGEASFATALSRAIEVSNEAGDFEASKLGQAQKRSKRALKTFATQLYLDAFLLMLERKEAKQALAEARECYQSGELYLPLHGLLKKQSSEVRGQLLALAPKLRAKYESYLSRRGRGGLLDARDLQTLGRVIELFPKEAREEPSRQSSRFEEISKDDLIRARELLDEHDRLHRAMKELEERGFDPPSTRETSNFRVNGYIVNFDSHEFALEQERLRAMELQRDLFKSLQATKARAQFIIEEIKEVFDSGDSIADYLALLDEVLKVHRDLQKPWMTSSRASLRPGEDRILTLADYEEILDKERDPKFTSNLTPDSARDEHHLDSARDEHHLDSARDEHHPDSARDEHHLGPRLASHERNEHGLRAAKLWDLFKGALAWKRRALNEYDEAAQSYNRNYKKLFPEAFQEVDSVVVDSPSPSPNFIGLETPLR